MERKLMKFFMTFTICAACIVGFAFESNSDVSAATYYRPVVVNKTQQVYLSHPGTTASTSIKLTGSYTVVQNGSSTSYSNVKLNASFTSVPYRWQCWITNVTYSPRSGGLTVYVQYFQHSSEFDAVSSPGTTATKIFYV